MKCEEHGLAGGTTKKKKSIGGGEEVNRICSFGFAGGEGGMTYVQEQGCTFWHFKPDLGQIKRRILTRGSRDNRCAPQEHVAWMMGKHLFNNWR